MSTSHRAWSLPAILLPLLAAAVPTGAQSLPTEAPRLSGAGVVNGGYTLLWDEITGGATQQSLFLRERTNAGAWGTQIEVTGANSRGFSNKPPASYGYQLRLREHDSESGTDLWHSWSAELTVMVPVASAPGAPGNLTATPAQSTGSFTLAWGAASGTVAHYAVHQRIDPNLAWPAQPVWTGNALSLARTLADGRYFYRVQACNASNNCGPFGNTVEVNVLGVPGVPGSLGPSVTTGTSYQLSWTAASGTVARYELWERVGLGLWQRIHNSLTRSRSFTEREEASYQYRVRACNSAAATALCSAYTAIKTVTVSPPANITGPTSSADRFTLSWTVPAGPFDIPQLEQRAQGSATWGSSRLAPGTSSTLIYRVCAQCERTWEFRLRFCEPGDSEPGSGFEGTCQDPGRVHRVVVDHPQTDSRTLASLPLWDSLSQDERTAWEDASLRQGVNGRSFVRQVGMQPQDKLWFGFPIYHWEPTWYPVDGEKHTLCGEVESYNVYDPGFPELAGDFAEADFNHMIIPNARHAYIRDEAGTSSRVDCNPAGQCVEAESTPDQAFFNNPWFNLNGTTLQGRDMCVHGAWVGDDGHGRRPEIHPYELAWWRTYQPAQNHTVYHLVALKDDSQRFRRWGLPPRAEFWIAFESYPNSPIWTLSTSEPGPWVRYVDTDQHGPSMWDADDGASHLLTIEGRDVVQVNEGQTRDDNIGVRFEGLSRFGDGRVRGYVVVRTYVGGIGADEAGFHVIRVDQDYGVPAAPAAAATRAAAGLTPRPVADRGARASLVPGSLRRITQEGRPALVMDLEVTSSSEDAAAGKPAIKGASLQAGEGRQPVRVEKGPRGGDVLREVPVLVGREALLELQTEAGVTVSRRLNGIGLTLRPTSATPVVAAIGQAEWPAALKAAGERGELPGPPAVLSRVTRWDLQVLNLYGAVRKGRVAVDEDAPLVRALNEAVRGGRDSLALFGSEPALTTDWSLLATDLTTGKEVPVVVGASAEATEVRVEMGPGGLPGERIGVSFPTQPEGHLYEVVATARSRDVFGAEGALTQRLWSVAVSGEDPDGLAAALLVPLAAEAGLPVAALRALSEAPAGADPGDPAHAQRRRARALKVRARHAAADGHVTVAELSDLLQVAALLQKRERTELGTTNE